MAEKELQDILRQEWEKRRRSGNSKECFDALVGLYTEPSRNYHNLKHISEVIEELGSCSNALYLAAWFHDSVYNPKLKDNEEKSAAFARKWCIDFGYVPEFADEVERLIVATRHNKAPETEDEKLLCDADLAILGAEKQRFEEYEAGIRKEYSFYADEAYYPVRAWVLERFLAKEHIYHTEKFRQKYEAKARNNLKKIVEQVLKNDTGILNFGNIGLKD